MSENPDRIERTLELLLYAPIGVGLFLKDTAPTFVNMFVSRGRAEVDRRQDDVQQRVTTARSLGQVALAFGPPVVRKRVEKTVADAVHRVEGLFGSPASDPTPHPRPEPPETHNGETRSSESQNGESQNGESRNGESQSWEGPSSTPSAPAPRVDAPEPGAPLTATSNADFESSAALAIPGYDALSASQVVERLIGLAPDELDAVHAYEASHRQRRTILGKIEQLAG